MCGGRLVPIFSTLFAIRLISVTDAVWWSGHVAVVVGSSRGMRVSMKHCYIAILLHGWRLKWQTNDGTITVSGQKPTLENSIDKDRIACYTSCTYMMLTVPITINPEKKGDSLSSQHLVQARPKQWLRHWNEFNPFVTEDALIPRLH